MNTARPSAEEFREILRAEVEKISSPQQIAFLDSIIIEPYQTRLSWEYGNGLEPYAYLLDLLEELPKASTGEALEALLPWSVKYLLKAQRTAA
jgi:hypothetical protein